MAQQSQLTRVLRPFLEADGARGGNPTVENSAGGFKMEARMTTVEKAIPEIRERLVRVETKLDHVEKHMATKADLEALRGSIIADVQKTMAEVHHSIMAEVHKSVADTHKSITDMQKTMTDTTWRFVQISLVLAGIAFTAARFIQ